MNKRKKQVLRVGKKYKLSALAKLVFPTLKKSLLRETTFTQLNAVIQSVDDSDGVTLVYGYLHASKDYRGKITLAIHMQDGYSADVYPQAYDWKFIGYEPHRPENNLIEKYIRR